MIVGENTLDLQGENWECCVGTKRARKTGRLDLYAVGYYYSSISRERERERERGRKRVCESEQCVLRGGRYGPFTLFRCQIKFSSSFKF